MLKIVDFLQSCQPGNRLGKLENSVKSHIGVLRMPNKATAWLEAMQEEDGGGVNPVPPLETFRIKTVKWCNLVASES